LESLNTATIFQFIHKSGSMPP